ncbi:MAG TPA: hypothetical protein VKG38_16525 [Solirubrobacteraceae bacterium]|nr:hypothetical protein [Solirubrobacteraceae bacterium]
MAFIRIVRPQLLTADVYDAVSRELDLEHDHPLGLISHAVGRADGFLQIVEIWDSEQYSQRFDRERLVPAIEAVTGSPPPDDAPTLGYPLHALVTP